MRTILSERLRFKKVQWFTLAELIVVIVVLAILATVGFLALSGYSEDARDSAIKANIRSVQTAITSEAAITGNSPRYYVVHDPDYALSGAMAFIDGTGVALTGGAWNSAGTNYSAGKPDFAKLKLNPDKFRISFGGVSKWFGRIASGFENAFAAYEPNAMMTAGADVSLTWTNGKTRSVSFVQTAAASPSTKIASVVGNFPTSDVPAGYVPWLLRSAPGSASNLTGALVDGGVLVHSASSESAVLPVRIESQVFEPIPVGYSITRRFALRNESGEPVTVSSPTVTGSKFTLVSSTCGSSVTTLATWAACKVYVSYSSSAVGTFTGSVNIPNGTDAQMNVALSWETYVPTYPNSVVMGSAIQSNSSTNWNPSYRFELRSDPAKGTMFAQAYVSSWGSGTLPIGSYGFYLLWPSNSRASTKPITGHLSNQELAETTYYETGVSYTIQSIDGNVKITFQVDSAGRFQNVVLLNAGTPVTGNATVTNS